MSINFPRDKIHGEDVFHGEADEVKIVFSGRGEAGEAGGGVGGGGGEGGVAVEAGVAFAGGIF